MNTQEPKTLIDERVTTLDGLRLRQRSLRKKIDEQEKVLKGISSEFVENKEHKAAVKSPVQRAFGILNNSWVVIDSAILGWKLYQKFGVSPRKKARQKKWWKFF